MNVFKKIGFLLLIVVIISRWPHLFQLGQWMGEQAVESAVADPVLTVAALSIALVLAVWTWRFDCSKQKQV